MTNKNKTTLYVGVTSNLLNRVLEHKTHKYKNSFTSKYNLEFIIYYEFHSTITEAILREKQIKKWGRSKKDELINSLNPNRIDLFDVIKNW